MCLQRLTEQATPTPCGPGSGTALQMVDWACRVLLGLLPEGRSSRRLDRGGLNRLSLSRFGLMWLWFPVPGPRLLGLLSGPWFPFLNIKMGTYVSGIVMELNRGTEGL